MHPTNRSAMNTDYQQIINQIAQEVAPLTHQGAVADYIPALAAVKPGRFAMAVKLADGREFTTGEALAPFSIQSISKLLTLTLFIQKQGLELGDRVGVEPSGNPFNSLVQLEYEGGKPRNPFINAGALVVTDGVMSHYGDAKSLILQTARKLSSNPALDYDQAVAASEKQTGFRNAALANFMKSYGNILNPVEEVLDTYFHQCSLAMSCTDLARMFFFLANEGVDQRGEVVTSPRETKRINALMMTCGTYDAVGDFAFRVGIPAKSGVGGGIVAVIPRQMSIAVWSPTLNQQGNSVAGSRALDLFTTYTRCSVF